MSATIEFPVMGNQHIDRTELIKKMMRDNREALLEADKTTPVKMNGICYDGIVDERVFMRQKRKIAFLLKETNANDKHGNMPKEIGDWDYQHWLKYQQAHNIAEGDADTNFYGHTFNKLCMWVDLFYRILDGEILPFEEYEEKYYNTENFRKNLAKTAIINLKKTWGSGSTNSEDLAKYLESKTVLKVLDDEMHAIGPDIVICGGEDTYNYAQSVFKGEEYECSFPVGDDDITLYIDRNRRIYLNFYHPACRKSKKDMYDFAVDKFVKVIKLFEALDDIKE